MSETLAAFVARTGTLPLAWSGGTPKTAFVNLGDALSPVVATLLSSLPVQRVGMRAAAPRLAMVGTIGHALEGGTVQVWGIGCDPSANPSAPPDQRLPYRPPPETRLALHATRGPLSERLLSGGTRPWGGGVYGDPVWLLPRHYRPRLRKRWRLGVVLHLTELAEQSPEARAAAHLPRYAVPPSLAGEVRLIGTLCPPTTAGLQAKLEEILACERIVSTSLHGLVLAEAYGIPCLYFAFEPPAEGPALLDLDPAGRTDARVLDFYGAFGLRRRWVYGQERGAPTDWEALIEAVDRRWEPLRLDEERLLSAWPLALRPLEPAAGGTVWQHPLIRDLPLRHRIGRLQALDRRGWPLPLPAGGVEGSA